MGTACVRFHGEVMNKCNINRAGGDETKLDVIEDVEETKSRLPLVARG